MTSTLQVPYLILYPNLLIIMIVIIIMVTSAIIISPIIMIISCMNNVQGNYTWPVGSHLTCDFYLQQCWFTTERKQGQKNVILKQPV